MKLEETVQKKIEEIGADLIESYRSKLKELSEEVEISNIEIAPLDFVLGDLESMNTDLIFESIAQTKSVYVKTEEVENYKKSGFFGWLKFWEPKYIEKDIYKDVSYVKGKEFAERYFSSPISHFMTISDETEKYIDNSIKEIKKNFEKKYQDLNQKLNEKLEELKNYSAQSDDIDIVIKENNIKLEWLERIQKRVDKILEI